MILTKAATTMISNSTTMTMVVTGRMGAIA
jgi:hypothetical protein